MSVPFGSSVGPALSGLILIAISGQIHCALMCGPLARAVAPDPISSRWQQFGRVLGYGFSGALVGAIGLSAGWMAAPLFSGIVIFLMACSIALAVWRIAPLSVAFRAKYSPPGIIPMGSLFQRIYRTLMRAPLAWPGGRQGDDQRQKHFSAWIAGLLSPLLPCGQLHLALGFAATTASPLTAALAMSSFALLTAPALLGWSFVESWLYQKFSSRHTKLLRATSAGLLVISGALSVYAFTKHLGSAGAVHGGTSDSILCGK